MANADRPRGLVPVGFVGGGSWNNEALIPALLSDAVETEHSSYFVGMPVTIDFATNPASFTEGLNHLPVVKPMLNTDDEPNTEGEALYGVCLGFTRVAEGGADTLNPSQFGYYDIKNLDRENRNFVDHAEIEADVDNIVAWLAPSNCLFEIQTDAAITALWPGEGVDFNLPIEAAETENGNEVTGLSLCEISAAEGGNFIIVAPVTRPDNDPDLANADWIVKAANPSHGTVSGLGS